MVVTARIPAMSQAHAMTAHTTTIGLMIVAMVSALGTNNKGE
jgi:hypothetical protein